MIGASGICKKDPCGFVRDKNMYCAAKRSIRDGQCFKRKIPCGECKSFQPVQTARDINTDLKRRCVYHCEHYDGFLSDHTDWIECKVKNYQLHYFADRPYKYASVGSADWIGDCTHFKQKKIPPKPRFESLDI